jgi:hypothetical protein
LVNIGRLGDRIPWADLPSVISGNSAIAAYFDATPVIPVGGGGLVCGSPNEVANDFMNFGGHEGTGFDLVTEISTYTC